MTRPGWCIFVLCLAIGCSKIETPTEIQRDEGQEASPQGGDGQISSSGRWVVRASLLVPRQEMSADLLNGKIYVPGGLSLIPGGAVNLAIVDVYDPVQDMWLPVASLPEQLDHLGVAAAGGKLYAIGGFNPSRQSIRDVFEYDPVRNRWVSKAQMPTSRGGHVAVAFGGKVYAIGGQNGGREDTGANEVYNPATDAWQFLTPMPTARNHLAAAAIDSLIYVVGGRRERPEGVENLAMLEVYAPASNTWTRKANMPQAQGGLAAASARGKLYVFGGEFFGAGGNGVFADGWEYDPVTDVWQGIANMPTPRHGMGAVAVGDTIYVLGGGTVAGVGPSSANEAFVIGR